MPSIGPELPPHLLKQQSSGRDDENEKSAVYIGPEVPPRLLSQRVAIRSEESEEEYGPTLPIGPELPPHPHPSDNAEDRKERVTQVSVGPEIPSHLSGEAEDNEEDDEDSYVPALPPDLLASRDAAAPSTSTSARRRVIGPSLPGIGDEDEEDEEIGPMPPPAGVRLPELNPVQEFMQSEQRRREAQEAPKSQPLKREEWMLVPPSSSDLLGSLDPTKLKARQFSRTSAPVQRQNDTSLWTETPAERQQRIADEVAGKKRRVTDAPLEDEEDLKRRKTEDEAIRRGVDDYTAKVRGPSLVKQHTASQKETEKKEPEVIWDHARDMSIGGRLMDDEKRSQLIREAKGLGDRFGHGKRGGFL